MSGTSLDGLDIAAVTFSGTGRFPAFSVDKTGYVPMPDTLKQAIRTAFTGTAEQVCLLNRDIGEFFAASVKEFMQTLPFGITPDAIASHGQTVWHRSGYATLQIGDADFIAKRTGLPVLFDFRPADTVFGGTGAPLVPAFDLLLAHPYNTATVFQNLGGIGNLTYIPAEQPDRLCAFDTGPANMLLNNLTEIYTDGAQAMDTDGRLAAAGQVLPAVLAHLMSHPYLQLAPPKSAGHEDFGMHYCRELASRFSIHRAEDVLRTAVRFVACVAADAYRRFCPGYQRVILSGGGIRHPVLKADFADVLAGSAVAEFETVFGFNPDYKEAAAFAYLGWCRCRGIPSNVPSATGAAQPVCLGKLAFPA
ncbi:hypothetical protein CHS0354_018461 [Potamilus streckersoni]|uniref:Anhydro-N-acetylmuramic acid kinase n=1 Tax=Potamilus streckersoni TaxID=2493646 RepID=A0AAE0TAG2_9BIVA|nr:hypothetical protein CHS0354_018461 [Potamilus streckersoni]